MTWVAVLSERAQRELVESWAWYEDKQLGLGDRFKDAVFKKLRQLEEDHARGLQRNPVYREAIIKTFPFLIIYRVEKKSCQIFIQSIFHTRRNPKKKYRTTK